MSATRVLKACDPDASLTDLIERLHLAVDRRGGIVARVDRLPLQHGDASHFHGFVASLGALEPLRDGPLAGVGSGTPSGYGTALSEPLAEVRAICEALERYCAVMPPGAEELTVASMRELGPAALDLTTLPRCSAAERRAAPPGCRLARAAPDRPIEWVAGRSLTRERRVLVPLSCVYLGLPRAIDEHLCFPVSTGFAAGQSLRGAIESGLREVIERDSLALWWIARTPFPRIAVERLGNASLGRVIEALRDADIDTTLFDLTTDVGAPVVGLVQRSRARFPHVVTMAACRASLAAAARRVVEEAASLRSALVLSRRGEDDFADVLSGQAVAAERFGLLHAGPEALARFDRLVEAAPLASGTTRREAGGGTLEELIAHFTRRDEEVVAVDVTLPEVRDLGLAVVRVLVPSLVPLSFAHAVRHLAHPRLRTALAEAGVEPNPLPIPYA